MNEPINHGVPTAVQLQWRRRPRNGAGEVYYTRITAETAWRSCCLGLTGCGSGTSVDSQALDRVIWGHFHVDRMHPASTQILASMQSLVETAEMTHFSSPSSSGMTRGR